MNTLQVAVILALIWCIAALAVLFLRARAFGPRKLFAKPAGDAMAGVRYAFIQGMAPQAKESVRMNLLSYLAGMLYHLGIFAALALLGANLAGLGLSRILGLAALAGGLAGVALLAKRMFKSHLRGLSCPDDFFSNFLATVFAVLAGMTSFIPALLSVWLGATLALLVYAPLGKIRHCVFFFSTRYHFGAFFGRRGVLPPMA